VIVERRIEDMGETLNEMEGLILRLNESRSARNLMESFSRTIQFDLEGEENKFFITIEGGRMTLTKGVAEKPDIGIAGDTKEFAKVVRGKLDVTHTIAHGHIRITKGKVSEMTLLNRILWVTERR
jgi:putative sterol carrier protein